MSTHVIDRELLYHWVDRKRRARRIPWSKVAQETEIPQSSLSRWTHGKGLTADLVGTLIVWCDGPPAIFIRRAQRLSPPAIS